MTEAVVTAEYLRHLRQGHLTELKNAVCELCLSAKGSKRPHKKVNEFKPTRDRQIVSFDTIGKIDKGFCGEEYSVNSVDGYSRWVECRPIARKSDAALALQDRIKYCGAFEVCRVDNGSEFRGQFLQKLIEDKIMVRYSSIYSPAQNGIVEVTNRIL